MFLQKFRLWKKLRGVLGQVSFMEETLGERERGERG